MGLAPKVPVGIWLIANGERSRIQCSCQEPCMLGLLVPLEIEIEDIIVMMNDEQTS